MNPTVVGALIGAGSAVIVALAGIGANVRNTRATTELSRRAVEAAQRTVEITEQGQVTDRYTKAIEQLGSDKIDVRIGGIYALERVARDSDRDHPTVMEVLAAFIRDHSLEPWFVPKSDHVRATRPDIQAALTVIARREATHDRQPIDLHGADLPQAMLDDANLACVIFTDADLTRAHLARANLAGADLVRTILHIADLTSADLRGAHVEMAKLDTADLTGADLTRARLAVAQLPGANIRDANFTSADLRRTNFIGAYNFNSAGFTGADFTDAPWSQGSPAPEGWVRDPDSRRLRRANTIAEDADN
jgi:uncharacterized protein YjbI with pentapeptide repeats